MPAASAIFTVAAVLQAAAASRTPCVAATRAHTQIKWLINTGDLASRWPPAARTGRRDGNGAGSRCTRCRSAMPNTITRLQMIRGGTAAVLVMPTGDGGRRCCSDAQQFSLGFVDLRHGVNNLYPIVHPFPDWRAFMDTAGLLRRPNRNETLESDGAELLRETAAEDRPSVPVHDTSANSCPSDDAGDEDQCRRHRIVNVVDAFLDDRGRLLWVLDTGDVGEDACYGTAPTGGDRTSSKSADEADDSSPPKFFAIDVYTNRTISVVSLSRVWRAGVSCFQYIVAVYPEPRVSDEFDFGGGNESVGDGGGREPNFTDVCTEWPLVVIGDTGTNRLLVYLHCKDKFTEIVLPAEERCGDGDVRSTTGGASRHGRRREWPSPLVRDILYVVPLYPRTSHSRLLITYHGCRDVYKLRLQVSTCGHSAGGATTPPVTGTLTVLGRKPCRMIILGTDRRRTDVGGGFAGGGTTVYFRLENTNDIWSWDVSAVKNNDCGSSTVFIDERDFRLVRVGRTCRVPVAVSAAAVASAAAAHANAEQVRQLVWVLETNFVDHFAGTADRMGVNAKLQPIEMPLSGGNGSADDGAGPARPRLRVQPNRVRQTQRSAFCRRSSAFKRQVR